MTPKHSITTHGAGTLTFRNQKVLLVQLNYGVYKGHWVLPGGMVEEGEHPHQAAIRETLEETGLNVALSSLLTVRHRIEKNRNNTYWVFNALIETTLPEKQITWPEEELISVKFWDIDEALDHEFVRPNTKYYIDLFLGNSIRSSITSLSGPHNDFFYRGK